MKKIFPVLRLIKFQSFISMTIVMMAFPAYANDTLYAITPDGLQFKKSTEISMESEDLYISLKQARVRYEFKNNSKKDITDIVSTCGKLQIEPVYKDSRSRS